MGANRKLPAGSCAIANCTQPLHRLQTPSNSMTGLPLAIAIRAGSACSDSAVEMWQEYALAKGAESRPAVEASGRKSCCASASRVRVRVMNELAHPRRQAIPGELVERIKVVVGPEGWSDDAAVLAPHLIDWRQRYQGR